MPELKRKKILYYCQSLVGIGHLSCSLRIIEELLRRVLRSAEEIDARSVIISGGVACNSGLRESARAAIPVYFPTPGLSTDNAAMCAAAAFQKLRRGDFADMSLAALPNLALA